MRRTPPPAPPRRGEGSKLPSPRRGGAGGGVIASRGAGELEEQHLVGRWLPVYPLVDAEDRLVVVQVQPEAALVDDVLLELLVGPHPLVAVDGGAPAVEQLVLLR